MLDQFRFAFLEQLKDPINLAYFYSVYGCFAFILTEFLASHYLFGPFSFFWLELRTLMILLYYITSGMACICAPRFL
jgi:hypothetical protein